MYANMIDNSLLHPIMTTIKFKNICTELNVLKMWFTEVNVLYEG